MSKNKAKIEGIYPLTTIQQAYLLHHLQQKEDIGLLQGHLILTGALNLDILKQAWQKTSERHAALRTSIHWEKIEKPVQVIHQQTTIPFTVYDWSDLSAKKFEEQLQNIKHDENYKITLSKAPVSKVVVIKEAKEKYILLWNCHHILLDGWSTSIILQDVFRYYSALLKKETPNLAILPTYKMYYEKNKSRNRTSAKKFWQTYFPTELTPTLFRKQNTSTALNIQKHIFFLQDEIAKLLKDYCRKERITISTFLKGAWSILLQRYFSTNKVVFGTTVSGRSLDLPNIDQMAGLFTNVLPIYVETQAQENFGVWLRNTQKEQIQALKYEHITLNEIINWANIKHASLFDSLIVIENIPWRSFESGGIQVDGVKKIPKTIYPLTIGVLPNDGFKFIFRYNQNVIPKKTVLWFAEQFQQLIKIVLQKQPFSIKEVVEQLAKPPLNTVSTTTQKKIKKEITYVAPQNSLELKLVQIWGKILKISPISVTDNFFEIGGKSLHAIRVLGLIEKELGHHLPPISLIQNPTVQELGKFIQGKNVASQWSSILPLKLSGINPPLFCIHAGGGHTFFYNNMVKYLDEEQPVYSIQPLGLEDGMYFHQSIEEMATDYLKDILEVVGEAPIIIMSYCFSMSVAIEISRQLQEAGKPSPMLIIVDGSPRVPNPIPHPTTKQRILRIFTLSPKKLWTAVKGKFTPIKEKMVKLLETKQERILRLLQENLYNLYSNYKWKPFNGKMTYIRSTEFTYRKGKDEHVKQWLKLANDGLDIYVVEGHHDTLFDEPEVQGLAKQIQICLNNYYKELNIDR